MTLGHGERTSDTVQKAAHGLGNDERTGAPLRLRAPQVKLPSAAVQVLGPETLRFDPAGAARDAERDTFGILRFERAKDVRQDLPREVRGPRLVVRRQPLGPQKLHVPHPRPTPPRALHHAGEGHPFLEHGGARDVVLVLSLDEVGFDRHGRELHERVLPTEVGHEVGRLRRVHALRPLGPFGAFEVRQEAIDGVTKVRITSRHFLRVRAVVEEP